MIKNIFILWFQGFDNAPEIVKKCLESWCYYNPDWNIVKLDNSNLHNYIDITEFVNDEIKKAHLSDIIRLMLLEKYGGVWADATTFCTCPLTEWISTFITMGFFAFSRPSEHYLFSNWFLYAEKDNYVLKKLNESTQRYYRKNKSAKIYLIQHQMANELFLKDKLFKHIWSNVPVFHAGISSKGIGPMFLQAINLFNESTPEIDSLIQSKYIPLFKLTTKCDYEKDQNEKTILSSLFSSLGK